MEKKQEIILSANQDASVKKYHDYIRPKKGIARVGVDDSPVLAMAAQLFKSDHDEVIETLTKAQLHLRDNHGRTIAHCIALLFGVEGLYEFRRSVGNEQLPRGFCYSLDKDGMTPGHYAMFSCRENINKLDDLISEADVMAANRYGHNMLELARIVDAGGVYKTAAKIGFVYSPELRQLHFMVSRGNVDDVRRVVGKDKNIVLNFRDGEQKTLLHVAVMYGQLEVLEYLLGCGANVNAIDCHGNTPLHYAVQYQDKCPKDESNKPEVSTGDSQSTPSAKVQAQYFIRSQGLMIQYILCKAGADFFWCNNAGQAPVHLQIERQLDNILVLYKMCRHLQKYSADYLPLFIQPEPALIKEYFADTLAGMDYQAATAECDLLAAGNDQNENTSYYFVFDMSFQQHYGQELVSALLNYLDVAYQRRSTNPVKIFNGINKHHRELRWHLGDAIGALKRSYDQLIGLPDNFNINAAQHILNDIVKGPDGAVKTALVTILNEKSNPNGDMMKFLSTISLLLHRVADLENQLEENHQQFLTRHH